MRSSRSFPRLKSKALLSPMAGVTDVAFRALAKRYGAGMTCTEFIHSQAITHGNAKTQEMLTVDPSEKPVAVQLFGNSVKDVVAAAQLVEDRFDVIDVNCGCPAWKVIKTGAGSALLNDPTKIARFVNTLASSVSRPVTIKIRTGIDSANINAVAVARAAEDAGAAAVAVHGRTQKQGYRGLADWDVIKSVKNAVSIPVIGNGDVVDAHSFAEKLRVSGVDAILIARGAIGNPAVFASIRRFEQEGTACFDSEAECDAEPVDRLVQLREYLTLAEQYSIPFGAVKTHAVSFLKGRPGAARLRYALAQCKSFDVLLQEIKTIE